MILTADQLQSTLEKRITDAGLAKYYERERSQFLDFFFGEVFVELVLNDGFVLSDAEKVVGQTTEELAQQGIQLDSVVRAVWDVMSVEYAGGTALAADEFRVVVRAGRRRHQLRVNVSFAATEILRHKLGLSNSAGEDDLRPEYFLREILTPRVQEFVEHALSRGGTSYWDPLQEDSPMLLTATDMSFLLGQSTTFDELRQAISDAFDAPVLESFLRSLSSSHAKVRDFDAVLPSLSSMLGGAYRSTETFSISARELYQRLERPEQELLKKYFEGKIQQLQSDSRFSAIVNEFSDVLS